MPSEIILQQQMMYEPKPKTDDDQAEGTDEKPEEIGGSGKPDPVRYGDWEIGGRCIDF